MNKSTNPEQDKAVAESSAATAPTHHKMTPKNLLGWLVVVVILLAALAGSMVIKNKYGYNPTKTASKESQKTDSSNPEIGSSQSPEYRYSFISFRAAGEDLDGSNSSGKIFRTDIHTGKQEVVVPDIEKAYNDPDQHDEIYSQLAVSSNKPYIYFTRVGLEWAEGIIKYDGSKNEFSKYPLSDTYDFTASSASPSEAFLISINNEESPGDNTTLYLTDLDNVNIIEMVKLPKTQTFNVCPWEGCMGDTGIEVTWKDGHTFEITAYDATKPKLGEPGSKGPVVVSRKTYDIYQYLKKN